MLLSIYYLFRISLCLVPSLKVTVHVWLWPAATAKHYCRQVFLTVEEMCLNQIPEGYVPVSETLLALDAGLNEWPRIKGMQRPRSFLHAKLVLCIVRVWNYNVVVYRTLSTVGKKKEMVVWPCLVIFLETQVPHWVILAEWEYRIRLRMHFLTSKSLLKPGSPNYLLV